eukprot:GHRQ01006968.1.p1 GENE.GHRQ01006968.1~~GHRQ01006968.1.p1  ORF type:complete len:248 (+),score=81.55 GHRQ01006968.1:207-950(+)
MADQQLLPESKRSSIELSAGTNEQRIIDMIQQHRSLRSVELSNVAGTSSSRQFDRSSSFTAGNPANWDDDSSDSSESLREASPSSWATGAFEPFEVEEQATEVKYLRSAFTKKEQECEHLRQIIKELSQSRSKAHKTKVELEEQFAGLQKEYYRVLKVSELARTVSQQSVSRAASLRSELATAQDHARRARRRAAAADKFCKELREENAALKQKVLLLERLHLELGSECGSSACARAYLFSHSMSLY